MHTETHASLLEAIDAPFDENFVKGSVKTAMKNAGGSSADLWNVPIHEIHVMPGFNTRVRDAALEAHIRWIADSIKASGFHRDEPLGCFIVNEAAGPKIYVHAGHNRLEAAKIARSEGAEITHLPVVVVPKETSVEDLICGLVTTNAGKPLTPYEISIVCKRLAGFGWNNSLIAQRLAFTASYVDALLEIPGYPLKIREMIQEGQVSVSMARDLVKTYSHKATEKLEEAVKAAASAGAKRVTSKHIPGRRFESFVKRTAPRLYEATRAVQSDPAYSSLSQETRDTLDALLQELNVKETELNTSDGLKASENDPTS